MVFYQLLLAADIWGAVRIPEDVGESVVKGSWRQTNDSRFSEITLKNKLSLSLFSHSNEGIVGAEPNQDGKTVGNSAYHTIRIEKWLRDMSTEPSIRAYLHSPPCFNPFLILYTWNYHDSIGLEPVIDILKGVVKLDGELRPALTRILGSDDAAVTFKLRHQQLQVARQQNWLLPKLMHGSLFKNLSDTFSIVFGYKIKSAGPDTGLYTLY